jgi:uncharacterized LabA/DUF88 family protein
MDKTQNMIEKPKVKVYIDGANMFYAQKHLSWNLDWGKIKDLLEKDKEIVEWRYYVAVKEGDEKMLGYLRYLNAIGFSAITKPLKKIKISAASEEISYIYKANFDVEITADILLEKSKLDEIIMFSGDSDFEYLVKRLKDLGRKVRVYSSRKTISWELKLAASAVVYLEDLKEKIKRE